MLRAWWAECKLYIFGFMLVVGAIGYWWHGHESYKAGKAAGDKEVATLKAKYAIAYNNAQSSARALQAEYDAQDLADEHQRTLAAQFQTEAAQGREDAAERSAAQFKAKLDDLRKHDPVASHWLDTRVPDSVQSAGKG